MTELGPDERAVLDVIQEALDRKKLNPPQLPPDTNEDTQWAMWLLAAIGPYAGMWKFATCPECGEVMVGSWYAWHAGVLIVEDGWELRQYPDPGCYLGSHKEAS